MENSNILLDEQPLIVLPKLATLLGLNEAIVLQQLHYWLKKNPKMRDGHSWIYNSISEWHSQFPFWSFDTVKRTIARLVDSGLIIKGHFNKSSFDRTLWYRLDYDALNETVKERSFFEQQKDIGANCTNQSEQIDQETSEQIAPINSGNTHQPIPENTTETTITSKKKVSKKETAAIPAFDEIIARYTSNQRLQEAVKDFIKMRVSMKKTPTNRALELIFEKLDKIAPNDEMKIEILNRSIINNWGDVFELKPPQGSLRDSPKKGRSPLEDLHDFLKGERYG
ncbi:MAG: hypothetical protein FWC11_03145 [Firmicutes bacterium]|nr:hypothetical protein [Bacillota bacterium]